MVLDNTWALLDKDFLLNLDAYRNKKLYAKVVSLNWDEEPIAEITGNILQGSINVDGSSIVRHTCNLTFVTNTVQIDEVSWSLRSKFYLYVGVENAIDPKYDNIIWFPEGMYILTSYSSTLNAQGYQISLQGKDKMCLLNGDISGALFAAHEFSTIYITHRDGTISKEAIPIYTIIREAVHQYAQEPYHNIVINDLDTCGVELLDYVGDDAKLYIYDQYEDDNSVLLSGSGTSYEFMWQGNNNIAHSSIEGIPSFQTAVATQIRFETPNDTLCAVFEAAVAQQGIAYNLSPFLYNGVWYVLHKRIDPKTDVSSTAGYRATDITYTGDLTVAVGGTITEMLNKIIDMLGEFEYFYDINGRFVFQRKRIYFNSAWTNAIVDENQTYYDSTRNRSSVTYDFLQGYLIESFQNKPQLNAIKNDFAIWGKLTGVNKTALPIHLRYAIDRKPRIYYSLLEKKCYTSNLEYYGQYDWRELIYQMARDNLAAHTNIKGLLRAVATQNALDQAKSNWQQNPDDYNTTIYDGWKQAVMYHYDDKLLKATNYAQYYKYNAETDEFLQLESEEDFGICQLNHVLLYGPDESKIYTQLTTAQIEDINDQLGYDYRVAQTYDITDTSYCTRNVQKEAELLADYTSRQTLDKTLSDIDAWQDTFKTGYDAYYADMLEFWPHLYRTQPIVKLLYNDDGTINTDEIGELQYVDDELAMDDYAAWVENGYWNPDYVKWDQKNSTASFVEPESMFFWIDFFDITNTDSYLDQYAVDVIGRRSKAVNDDKVKAIYFRDTPNLLFVSPDYEPVDGEENLAYARINLVSPYSDYFRISAQGKSAKEELDSMLYDATYFQESITISSVPIYYLEPNTRIAVHDEQSGIDGEYLIKSLSIQLKHDGMMSITATRAVDRII